MRFYFASSSAFHSQLTSLYDLINPSVAAMWNLRWQVRGYVDEMGTTSPQELHGRFVAGSGISSANLRRHCIERSWDDQLGEVAVLALFSAVALYEGWGAALEVGTANQRERLQFPSQGIAGQAKIGAGDVIGALQKGGPYAIDQIYGPTLRSNPRYVPDRLDDLLLAYRCFKEIRNSCAHAGRIATPLAASSHSVLTGRTGGLGMRGGAIALPAVVEGQPVALTLMHVAALWAVLLKLVVTLDADLANTGSAEQALITRWRAANDFVMLSATKAKRHSRLRLMNNRASLPEASNLDELYLLLKAHRLVI